MGKPGASRTVESSAFCRWQKPPASLGASASSGSAGIIGVRNDAFSPGQTDGE